MKSAENISWLSYFTKAIPVTPLRKQAVAGIIIGLTVFLILSVFQPFGTFELRMKYKYLFLAGYGVICTLVYFLYYAILMTVLPFWFRAQKWNLLKEIASIIPVLFLISTASLFYHNKMLGGYKIGLSEVFYFFKISLGVAIFPFSVLFYTKFLNSRLTVVTPNMTDNDYAITFESNNKKEKPVKSSKNSLIYIKSEGNYIEIAQKEGNETNSYLIRNSLSQVAGKLPVNDFLKIHRSFIVNIHQMDSLVISGSSYQLKLKDSDALLPVSRSVVKSIRQIID